MKRNGMAGRLAMIDSGNSATWSPSTFIRYSLNRATLNYLFITNADQDHISDLQGLWDHGIHVPVWHRNPTVSAQAFKQIKERGGPLTNDAWRYLSNLSGMTAPVSEPFNNHRAALPPSCSGTATQG
jgi:beta-lactamase superfamily II metal-dependent hydrolase